MPGALPITADYVIFLEDGVCKALNGRTGLVEFIQTDETDAIAVIQSALDALTEGGLIFVKAGLYEVAEVNRRLLIPSNITLKGEGINSTIFRITTAVGSGGWTDWRGFIENKVVGASNIHLSDFSIEMPNEYDLPVEGPTPQVYNVIGIVFDGVSDSSIQRVRFYKIPGYSIRIRGDVNPNKNILIRGCKFLTSTWGPIIEGQYTKQVIFTECYSEDQFVGISLWGCRDVVVSNNITYRNDNDKRFGLAGACGIMPEREPLENVVVIGNTCLDEEHAIATDAAAGTFVRNIAIIGNIVRQEATDLTYGEAFALGRIKDSIIANNVCLSPNKGMIIGSGDSTNLIVTGNIVNETRLSDIGITIKGSYNIVTGNKLIDIGVGASYDINVECSKSLFQDNMMYDSDGTHSWHGFYLTATADDNVFKGNYLYNLNRGFTILAGADNNKILENIFEAVATPISDAGTNNKKKENIGYVTENSGTATFSGDGVVTDFLIGSHGLAENPTERSRIHVGITPVSGDAVAASPCVGYVSDEDADGEYESIRVKFSTAPALGTDNVGVRWSAELY